MDPFTNIKFNYEYIDWSDPAIDNTYVMRVLMGSQAHWKAPEFEGMTPLEIEKEILFEAGRENWGLRSEYGKPLYQHFLTLIRLLDPSTDIHPSLADSVMIFCMSQTFGKKIMNLIGCQNASKSASSVRIGFACLYIDPEYSAVYVANPFDNAADSTIWGEIEHVWDSMCHHHPCPTNDRAPAFFPDAKVYANSSIEVIPNIPKAARIELRNVKHVGKYKGTKAKMDRDNNIRGILLMLIDEVNEIDNDSFLGMLNNLVSQDNFFVVTSQNFKDVEDMGGRLTEPSGKFGGPSTFDELDVEQDIIWHSAVSSITLRFDGLKAPNILAQRVIYKYLFKQANLDLLKDNYGEASPEWFSQCRSFPIRGGDANSVLTQAKVSQSRHTDRIFSIDRILDNLGFCDPSFGGRDKALWENGKTAIITTTDAEGSREQIQVLLFTEHTRTLKLDKDATYNEFWIDRVKSIGVSISDIVPGSQVSYEDQIAIQCAEHNRREGVVPAAFGFDFSMRPDIVSSMNRFIGFEAHAFDYAAKPTGYYLHSYKQNTEDCCFNQVDELAFLCADLFNSRQIRGGDFIEVGTLQLMRTRYETKNGKYKVERKADFKARWSNVSPDHRDTLMGIAGMAHKRGFRKERKAHYSGTIDNRDFDLISSSNAFKRKKGKRARF